MIGVAISGGLFFSIHAFARPPPRSMTKEWQEATNEYLRVCHTTCHARARANHVRPRNPTPSTVSAATHTRARVMFRVLLQSRGESAWSPKSKCILGGCELLGFISTALHCTVAIIPANGRSSLCKYSRCCRSSQNKDSLSLDSELKPACVCVLEFVVPIYSEILSLERSTAQPH